MLYYRSNGRKPIKYEKIAAIESSTLPASAAQPATESVAGGAAA
jgi:hypothetical protein